MKKRTSFLFTSLSLLAGALILTPQPSSWLVRRIFEGGVAIIPKNYTEIESNVVQYSNLIYPSQFNSNELDIISPKQFKGKLPVIIWVHGGAFVAGDKTDITEYAVQIAAHGYHIVNLNYALAPKAKYPSPLLQLNDVYKFVMEHADQYGFDMDQIYFAGDSAGAQIVSQYANIQTNVDYAKLIGIKALIPSEQINGLLLFCGPYNIQKLDRLSDNKLIAFLLKRVGWGYIGTKSWQTSDIAKQASPINYVTSHYPASFITDGNFMTFDEHGLEFVDKLMSLGVTVETKFYTNAQLPHEYQFMMNTPQAEETFDAVLDFLRKTAY